MGIDPADLARRFPVLFHMAEAGSWPSIRKHGLLSTAALVDLFEIQGEHRRALVSSHRPECVPISHERLGTALLRDQKPMDDRGLRRCLRDGLTPRQWYEILNDKVFFWVTRERLERLLAARAYRDRRQTILEVRTSALVDRHGASVLLSPMNSGCTKPFPHPRGTDTFRPLAEYPFDERARKNRREPIVEVTVTRGVPDIRDLVLRVEECGGGKGNTLLYEGSHVRSRT